MICKFSLVTALALKLPSNQLGHLSVMVLSFDFSI